MVVGSQLLGTEYVYYDNSGTTVDTTFRYDSLNLSTATVEGMFQVGSQGLGAAFYDGYMTPIPTEWQSLLGATAMTGNAALSILSRTSNGPAAFGFNPSALNNAALGVGSGGATTPVTTIPYVYYPVTKPLGQPEGPSNGLFDGGTLLTGMTFVPGTSTVLFFGSIGQGNFGYGEASSFADTNRTSKGYHNTGGIYNYQLLAYNANDFLAVKNGQMNPWDLRPYATWHMNFPIQSGGAPPGGMTFDPATGRLYVEIMGADTEAQYSSLPLIEVYQLSTTQSPSTSQSSSSAALLTSAVVSQPSSAPPLVTPLTPANGNTDLGVNTNVNLTSSQ